MSKSITEDVLQKIKTIKKITDDLKQRTKSITTKTISARINIANFHENNKNNQDTIAAMRVIATDINEDIAKLNRMLESILVVCEQAENKIKECSE